MSLVVFVHVPASSKTIGGSPKDAVGPPRGRSDASDLVDVAEDSAYSILMAVQLRIGLA